MEERRREEQTKMSEDATRLMNERNNVFPEQNMDEDVTFLSVRHPSFGTIRRLFNKEVTMNSCYDCILI